MPSSGTQSFAKDVMKLVTGTTFAQVITILASPVLTRLYGPEAFGLLAIFTSITSIIGVIACMRYELAIMLPKDDREAANVLGLCLLCAVLVSLLTIPCIYFGGDVLLSLLKAPNLAPYLILIPLIVFIGGVFLALNYWNSRTKLFGRLSIAQVISSLSGTGTKLGAGFGGYATAGGLIGGNLVGSSVSTVVLGWQIWRDDHVLLHENISGKEMLVALKRYKKFPLIESNSALLNTISWQLPAFLLATFFSPVVVGYYSLGFVMLQLPMSLIGGAIAQVFYQRASEADRDGNLAALAENVFHVLLTLSMFSMLLLAVVGKDLFLVVFGEAWGEAGVYAQILSIWGIFWFISSPLSTIIAVREKLTLGLNITILNFITRLVSLVIGGVMGNVLVAITLFSVSGIFTYGIACIIFLKMVGIPVLKTVKIIANHLWLPLLFLTPLLAIKYVAPPPYIMVICAGLIFVGYYLYVYFRDPQLRIIIGNL